MNKLTGLCITVVSTGLIAMGSIEPAHCMSFGKHQNNAGPGNQGVAPGYSNGNGNENHSSYDAHPYQVPVPEPSSVLLLASGITGLAFWRLKNRG